MKENFFDIKHFMYVPAFDLSTAKVSVNLNPHNFSLAKSFTMYFDFRVVIGMA